MMNDFIWYVHESGYHLGSPLDLGGEPDARTGFSGSDGPWIRPIGPTSSPRSWHLYAPLRDDRALFRKFADISCKFGSEPVVNFADQFGLLTNPEGEPLATFEAAIADMRSLVKIWENAKSDLEQLPAEHEYFKLELFTETCQTVVRPDHDVEVTTQSPKGAHRTSRFQGLAGRDLFEFLAAEINHRIQKVRTVFFATSDNLLDGLTHRLMPTTLLDAMWLQFGHAVEANRSFDKCRQCGTWFDMSPKAARINRAFCTVACKAKAYRRRQAKKEDDSGKGISKSEADND